MNTYLKKGLDALNPLYLHLENIPTENNNNIKFSTIT